MTMKGVHTEAVLKKLTKPESIQLLLKTETTLGSQIADLSKEVKDSLTHFKKLEVDIAVVRAIEDRLVDRIVKIERCAGKTPSIPYEKPCRFLSFLILLIIVSLKERCVVFSKRLFLKLTSGMFKPLSID